jgi:uncharacterized protein (TIGR02246 family)
MKRIRLCLAIALGSLLTPAVADTASRDADTAAITSLIDQWNRGWQTKDPSLAAAAYSDDADWTNAFGFHQRGRAAIESFLGEVFQLPFVMAAESKVVDQEIRFVSRDVACARTRVERTGQTTPDGRALGTRTTHHLRVLAKRDKQWVIVSHLISDARDPSSPAH